MKGYKVMEKRSDGRYNCGGGETIGIGELSSFKPHYNTIWHSQGIAKGWVHTYVFEDPIIVKVQYESSDIIYTSSEFTNVTRYKLIGKVNSHTSDKEFKGISIEVEKVITKFGGKCYRILKVTGILEKDRLPEEYLSGDCFYWDTSKSTTKGTTGHITREDEQGLSRIYLNDEIPEKDFLYIIKFMKKAGDRLHDINDKIRKDKESWKGKEIIRI
jgi:hypothetical protein